MGHQSDTQEVAPIANSVSIDEQEECSHTSETASIDAEAFLDSYEAMLRLQDDELTATLRHLRPLLEILESRSPKMAGSKQTTAHLLTKEFSFHDLKRALRETEEDSSLHFMASDSQWKMVLQLLTENSTLDYERISWAEIVMCYRTCIIGMQTLDQTPYQGATRTRVRARALYMLRMFRGNVASEQGKTVDKMRPEHSRFDGLFVAAVVLFVAVALSLIASISPNAVKPDVAQFEMFSRPPLIPGPHVLPYYDNESMTFADPTKSTDSWDAILVPGPTVSPFYEEGANKQINPNPAEASPATSTMPTSVRGSRESSKPFKKMQRPFQNLGSVYLPTKHNDIPTAPSGKRIQSSGLFQSPDRDVTKKGLAVAAIAGGTAAAGALVPMATHMIATLGASIPGLLSIGATVVVSTLLAHGIRDWVAGWIVRHRGKA